MEVIRLPGYTEDEKVNIADRYLVPKAIKDNGLRAKELTVHEEAIRDIVRRYTREAGVRSLEREVSKIARKVVKEAVSKKPKICMLMLLQKTCQIIWVYTSLTLVWRKKKLKLAV